MLFCAVQLQALVGSFRGFFIQARTGDSVNSIIGVWMSLDDQGQGITCNGVSGVCSHN